jgi:hypothetical protein
MTNRYLLCAAVVTVFCSAPGCKKAGRSLIQVDVSKDSSVVGVLSKVVIDVSQGGKRIEGATFAWVDAGLKVGVYVSGDVSGNVQVSAVGRDGADIEIAGADAKTLTVTPGQNTSEVVSFLLVPRSITDGGGGDAGTDARDAGGNDVADSGSTGGSGPGGSGPGSGGAGGTASGGRGAGGSGTGGGIVVRTWSTAEMLENDLTDYDDFPVVAMNASGSGVVTWVHGSALWARPYAGTSKTWGTAVMVSPVVRSGNHDVGVDGQGNLMAVWARDDAPNEGIWWSRSTNAGVTWSVPKRIVSGKAFVPTLAVGDGGTALAAWIENPGDNLFQVASCDFRGTDWNVTLNRPKPAFDTGDRNPRLSVDGAGRGFLIWQQTAASGEVTSIWTERYDGMTWVAGSIATLEFYTAGDAVEPTIALNEKGEGTAIWTQRGGATPQLWARRYDGTNWKDPEVVASGYVSEAQIAIDPSGSSVAIWDQSLPTFYNVRAARHVAGAATWEAPLNLETNNQVGDKQFEYAGPLVGMDSGGNAVAVWRKQLATARVVVYASQLPKTATVWTPVNGIPLYDDGTHTAYATSFALSRNGTGLAAWSNGDANTGDIWGAVFR